MRRVTSPRATTPDENERGAIIVIWAVALTAIMGLVALSVDLGNIAQTKRHTQSAVDAAVLAGAVDLASLVPFGAGLPGSAQSTAVSNAEAAAVADATTYLLDNYHLSSVNWNSSSCSLPAGVSLYKEGTPEQEDCFGFFPSAGIPYGMAIQIPAQYVKSSFGAADGFAGQNVSSIAYASVATAESSYLLPYVLPATEAGLDCIKTGSGTLKNDPCAYLNPGAGQRGFIDSPRYFDYVGNDNASNPGNPVLQTNLTLGVDHLLNVHNVGSAVYCDLDQATPTLNGCDSSNFPPPHEDGNAVVLSTGLNAALTQPLFTGSVQAPSPSSCVFGPRLNHPAGFVVTGQCPKDAPSGGYSLGSTPLLSNDNFGSTYPLNGESIYSYLTPYGQTWASSCSKDLPAGGAAVAIDAMQGATVLWETWNSCFSALLQAAISDPPSVMPPTSPIFLGDPTTSATCAAAPAPCDIEASPRFGTVPIIDGNAACGGKSCAEPILSFEDVYLNLAYQQGSFGKKNAIADEIQAWVFPQQWIYQPSPSSTLGGAFEANLCAWGVNC